jgi:hypothetical protein
MHLLRAAVVGGGFFFTTNGFCKWRLVKRAVGTVTADINVYNGRLLQRMASTPGCLTMRPRWGALGLQHGLKRLPCSSFGLLCVIFCLSGGDVGNTLLSLRVYFFFGFVGIA